MKHVKDMENPNASVKISSDFLLAFARVSESRLKHVMPPAHIAKKNTRISDNHPGGSAYQEKSNPDYFAQNAVLKIA